MKNGAFISGAPFFYLKRCARGRSTTNFKGGGKARCRNIERQRNADLRDDGQLMALLEMRVEKDRPHLKPEFCPADLAELLGISQQRLTLIY